jgi:transcription initiation factor IIE alpha subunit
LICKICGVWYDPVRGCDHEYLSMAPNFICSNCGWKAMVSEDFSLNDLPPCPVCNSFMDAFKIVKASK